jgi:hypothetical protein
MQSSILVTGEKSTGNDIRKHLLKIGYALCNVMKTMSIKNERTTVPTALKLLCNELAMQR